MGDKCNLLQINCKSRTLRNKNKSYKKLFPTPFFLGSTSLPALLWLPTKWYLGMRNGGCGQFITHHLCHSFSWCPSPTLAWAFSHRMQFFMNFSSMGPSKGAILQQLLQSGSFLPDESFRSGLLQCESSMGLNSCKKPLSHVVLSLQAAASSRSYQPPPVWVLHSCWWTSPSLQSSVGYRETACITTAFTTGCRGISLPPPSSPILASAGLFLSHFLTLSAPTAAQPFFPFL